jgi:cytochrome b subunit of formate dehydrogenase
MAKTISKQKASLVDILRMLAYVVALFCCVVLTITGFFPLLVLGEHISGFPVMIHATLAPVFSVCLAVLAVMWASRCRFTYADCPWFQRLVQWITSGENAGGETAAERPCLGQKVTFWLILILALPLILSMVLIMLSLFGTHGQEVLLGVHRCTAAIFVLVVVAHTFLLVRALKKR